MLDWLVSTHWFYSAFRGLKKYPLLTEVLYQLIEGLYDDTVISEDALFAWEKNDDPAEGEGKGVAVTSIIQFLQWLKNAEEDDEIDEADETAS
jgi:eIF4-gamma/eIF5/eIF2-epsilon